MYVYLKYVIVAFAFAAGISSFNSANVATGVASAGAFIAFALIEIQDLKIKNKDSENVDI